MSEFEGFSEEAIEVLLGIRFNNTKEWYEENKDKYKQYVHQPMAAFADKIYEKLHAEHEEFDDRPKVCRVFRDTRFSANKNRYKDSKWFFLREGAISTIEYPKPNFFFELKAENYIYGLGFWAKASHMERFRNSVKANPSKLDEVMNIYENQQVFTLNGDVYKKKFQDDVEEPRKSWYIHKDFTFIADRPVDDILFSPEIVDMVAGDFLKIYPLYEYFSSIMQGVQPAEGRYRRG
ncbi:DUF2461 domain-containing protein [Tyzzerella sp. OttesenSCG-928-J15]|nr:DUF2461 domain-containing protein [Tyzzerella sp. OttesenSCG-928-J15]